jgi:hypothetical protein
VDLDVVAGCRGSVGVEEELFRRLLWFGRFGHCEMICHDRLYLERGSVVEASGLLKVVAVVMSSC